MNPLTNIKNTQKISDREIELGTAGTKNSWHNRYKDSAWVYVGGLPYDLTEGDVICVFSQCGEIVNCNMVRDQKTGKSKGFIFLCYEDQRSTILAVDNLNGIKILNRTIRVDHVLDYKPPKDNDNDHDLTKLLKTEGCAPKPISESESEEDDDDLLDPLVQMKREKKVKKKKKEKKHKKKSRSSSLESFDGHEKRVKQEVVVKKERLDPGYGDTDESRHQNSKSRVKRDRSDESDTERKWRRDEDLKNNWRERSYDRRDQDDGRDRSRYTYTKDQWGRSRHTKSRSRSRSPRRKYGRSRSPRRERSRSRDNKYERR